MAGNARPRRLESTYQSQAVGASNCGQQTSSLHIAMTQRIDSLDACYLRRIAARVAISVAVALLSAMPAFSAPMLPDGYGQYSFEYRCLRPTARGNLILNKQHNRRSPIWQRA
jgi:hypothetical protein